MRHPLPVQVNALKGPRAATHCKKYMFAYAFKAPRPAAEGAWGGFARGPAMKGLLAVLLGLTLAVSAAAASEGRYVGVLPWEAANGTTFPWEGLHDDLDALLKVQVSCYKHTS